MHFSILDPDILDPDLPDLLRFFTFGEADSDLSYNLLNLDTSLDPSYSSEECCGAETTCLGSRSGSDSGSNYSIVTTCYHSFHIKKGIFHVFFYERIST
jgi:hypothetical protein